jgi:hypothetical protein
MVNILQPIEYNPQEWQKKLSKFNEIFAQAQALEKEDQGNPYITSNLAQAYNLYQQCNYLIANENVILAAQNCQQKINWRHQFQTLFNEGKEYLKQNYFKKALGKLFQAKKLFSIQELEIAIKNCQDRLVEEEKYEKVLQQTTQLARKGYFQQAFMLLQPICNQFPRMDGKEMLFQLQEIIFGKSYFRAGLLAEKKGNLALAQEKYQAAIQLIPEVESYLIRLGIVNIKLKEFSKALEILQTIDSQQSYYLQGYIYAQQKQWKNVYQSWKHLPDSTIKKQQDIIQKLVIRDRLNKTRIIENFIELKQIEESQLACEDFIRKFGADPIIKKNLDYHIIPNLEYQPWEKYNLDLNKLNQIMEKKWLQEPSLTKLHNLMVSQYYLYYQDEKTLDNLIPLWITTLINLENNPIFQEVNWLNHSPINYQELQNSLQQLLEEYIEKLKDNDLELYLKIRDSYNREKWALKLIQDTQYKAININNILLSPGLYEKYYKLNPNITLPLNEIGALYTPWGYAVSACLEKDINRAIAIKPVSITSKLEKFAQCFVFYNIGCFYLENNQWQEGISFLNKIKNELIENREWIENLDILCEKQRDKLDYFSEHLEFSEFWYDLIQTNSSINYFTEYQAQKIILNLEQEKISHTQALFKLKQLQKLTPTNPVVNDLIEKLEFEKELNLINNLLIEKQFEQGIEQAKNSKSDRIKIMVAELCVHILIEGFSNHELNFNDIYQLGKWAYELHPDDPAVKEIYNFSQELYEIQNLMLKDKFDQAVDLAKYSDHDQVRQYVAEFFIKTLLAGLESGEMPSLMVKQLGFWAYNLCPEETSYQAIYERLNIPD